MPTNPDDTFLAPTSPAGAPPVPEFRVVMVPPTPEDARADLLDQIAGYFRPRGTLTVKQASAIEHVRQMGTQWATMLAQVCPYSTDRATAIRKVREATFFATEAILHTPE